MFEGIKGTFRRDWLAHTVGLSAARKAFKAVRSQREKEGSFEQLTPALLEDDRFTRYERELVDMLGSEEILNIAITGGYGADKSSVIKTFFDRHPEFPYALVSLATFSKAEPTAAPEFWIQRSRMARHLLPACHALISNRP